MTTQTPRPIQALPLIGPGVDRVDGLLKVAGAAHYPGDFSFPNLAHAVLIQSTIAAGRIRRIDTGTAEAAPGVLAVITPENAGRQCAGQSAGSGRIHHRDDLERGEAYTDILSRHGLDALTADGENAPRQDLGLWPAGAFGAKLVEVHVDPDLGLIRVARIVSAIDGGRILKEKLAASQIIGGTVGGIGMALLEETVSDPGTGRIANATFGDYLVAVNADVPDMEVLFVGEPDPMNPIGTKGVGEIGIVGIAPAIANAVFHATGKRVRDLPITLDKLLD